MFVSPTCAKILGESMEVRRVYRGQKAHNAVRKPGQAWFDAPATPYMLCVKWPPAPLSSHTAVCCTSALTALLRPVSARGSSAI